MNNSDLKISIIKTLSYHQVFNYPLTLLELHKYLIKTPASVNDTHDELANMPHVKTNDGRYCISKPEHFTTRRYTYAWNLIQKTQSQISRLTSMVGDILMVAVSGSCGALYPSPNADIDLFIITRQGTLWTTRALTLATLRGLGLHVDLKKDQGKNSGRMCANLFIEDTIYQLEQQQRDLYTAMEIAHLKVIFNKQHTFERFLKANMWISEYLPNFVQISTSDWSLEDIPDDKVGNHAGVLKLGNRLAKNLQQNAYSLRHAQNLDVQNNWQTDHRGIILSKFQELFKKNQNKVG
ncbi:hypothetical protein KC614_01510 [candidate division WWE3 bacterium]|uniref:Polymerase nucleotidyl transferase domain-containing protein n=1 Tax=candidate division WWE3 bacterium TaxID=2053526 RepID=A0A955LL52_UNCKA|nr:hypothetical protein [candidate division WWE3 bacterium]